ncbi:MAG TPA: KTSC domain-containing protein [Chryseolinea sp.]
MKRIIEYRRLLGVGESADLKELKTIYRNFMKDWHPDKFQSNEEKAAAEEKSRAFIEAYHFLVSIAPETHAQKLEEYTAVITTSKMTDFQYKGQTLQVYFADGAAFEYFGVPRNIYLKLVNADSPDRFARRHIYSAFIYRKVTKAVEA